MWYVPSSACLDYKLFTLCNYCYVFLLIEFPVPKILAWLVCCITVNFLPSFSLLQTKLFKTLLVNSTRITDVWCLFPKVDNTCLYVYWQKRQCTYIKKGVCAPSPSLSPLRHAHYKYETHSASNIIIHWISSIGLKSLWIISNRELQLLFEGRKWKLFSITVKFLL